MPALYMPETIVWTKAETEPPESLPTYSSCSGGRKTQDLIINLSDRAGISKWRPVDLTYTFCVCDLWTTNGFYIFKWLEKIQRMLDTWKWSEIPKSGPIKIVLLRQSLTSLLMCHLWLVSRYRGTAEGCDRDCVDCETQSILDTQKTGPLQKRSVDP